jgi:hypothetical protein
MSRWHDRSPGGIATWANLSLDERLGDRVSDILLAAHEVHELLANAPDRSDLGGMDDVARRIHDDARAVMSCLPRPADIPERDPELAAVLDRIGTALNEISILSGPEYDVMLGWVEHMAAPNVLSLFNEIERLDALLGHSDATEAW